MATAITIDDKLLDISDDFTIYGDNAKHNLTQIQHYLKKKMKRFCSHKNQWFYEPFDDYNCHSAYGTLNCNGKDFKINFFCVENLYLEGFSLLYAVKDGEH